MNFYTIPTDGQTWLICGGRNFLDRKMFDSALFDLVTRLGFPTHIVHGAARGADTLAAEWADRYAIRVTACPADWEKWGKAAGIYRNVDMLNDHKPSVVVAFPGGRGTAHMIETARKRDITVAEIIAEQTPGDYPCP